jgi:hypothetical protein
MGPFHKRVLVWCDDPVTGSMVLELRGEVKPVVTFEPGAYVSLWGTPGSVRKEELTLINHYDKPLHITGVRSDLTNRIHWQIREIRAGFEFKLTIEDRVQTPGDYTGHLFLETDNPLKRELIVIVRGDVTAP